MSDAKALKNAVDKYKKAEQERQEAVERAVTSVRTARQVQTEQPYRTG